MIRANFDTVITILALHIDPEVAKLLRQASETEGAEYEILIKLAEKPIMSMMHDAYEGITSQPTPLHIYPLFVSGVYQYLENNNYKSLGHFLESVLSDMDKVKEDLAKVGITVTITDSGIHVKTDGGLHVATSDGKAIH